MSQLLKRWLKAKRLNNFSYFSDSINSDSFTADLFYLKNTIQQSLDIARDDDKSLPDMLMQLLALNIILLLAFPLKRLAVDLPLALLRTLGTVLTFPIFIYNFGFTAGLRETIYLLDHNIRDSLNSIFFALFHPVFVTIYDLIYPFAYVAYRTFSPIIKKSTHVDESPYMPNTDDPENLARDVQLLESQELFRESPLDSTKRKPIMKTDSIVLRPKTPSDEGSAHASNRKTL